MTESSKTTAETYNRLGALYDTLTSLPDKFILNRMASELLVKAQGNVLEVGVGSGKNLKRYTQECKIIGVDVSEKMLQVASREAQRLFISFEPYLGDATRLHFLDQSFDTVVCTLAGCTFDDPSAVYTEMRRVCDPKGRALFLEHVLPTSPALQHVCHAIAPLTKRALHCDPTRDSESLIKAAGWTIVNRQSALSGSLIALVAVP
jgi:demethylmenaquinone methyltransferase/2-methoxy-6-polyprenyl-1,4-benzoquinol methylase